MKMLARQSSIKTIKPNHPAFIITDGLTVAPRAGFEINKKCPREYSTIIVECIRNGWLLPIANLTEKEITLFGLSK